MNRMLLSIILFFIGLGIAQDNPAQPKKKYFTRAVSAGEIQIDGQPDEPAWDRVEWGGRDFVVHQPNEGEEPTGQTAFKILYDPGNLYVVIRAFDDEPDKIVRRMSRRDGFEGDWVEINIDSYFDHRTAFSFTITAAGVKGDEFISQNGNNWDSNWDPIWFVKTHIDDEGWLAEMRIPLSQLRFGNKDEHIWGIQFTRRYFRKNERSNWQFVRQNAPGWVHLFGELHGIKGIRPQRQIEILPYALTKTERFEREDKNPFATGEDYSAAFGLDAKIGLTSDLVMDITVNPDFGQVEADPSEVNLTAFETFFQEKRPFFIEGRNIFDYQVTDAAWNGSYASDNLFYSRRIGRRPARSISGDDTAFVDNPLNTAILGAIKVSGKTKNGLSVGILESITSRERAEIDSLGARRRETVEPPANYVVGRIRRDYDRGNTALGGIFTAANRRISDNDLNFLHTSAYSGGIDFDHNWGERTYYISGNVIASHVEGDSAALLETQTASARYFQRPDAGHLTLDSSRTSLSGHGGSFSFGRRGDLKFQTGVTWRSPGLELNDIGFLRQADEINNWNWIAYRVSKPFAVFHYLQINVNEVSAWNFDGVNRSNLINSNGNLQFKNYWSFGASVTHEFSELSTSALRGGPALRLPSGTQANFWINSDQRKPLVVEFGAWREVGGEDYRLAGEYWAWVSFRPLGALSLTINPSYFERRDDLQYIDTVDGRYLFGRIKQKTMSLTFRLNYSPTPTISLQYYASPFVSAGAYSQFKKITAGDASRYENRFQMLNAAYDGEDDIYTVDENGNSETDFEFDDPDFNFRDFNSNLVFRWEYSPGSVLFLVWSQARNSSVSNGRFAYGNDLKDLFGANATNVFLLKISRWFSL